MEMKMTEDEISRNDLAMQLGGKLGKKKMEGCGCDILTTLMMMPGYLN